MALSSAGEALLLTSLLTGRYVSLHTAAPSDAGNNEVSGGAYVRKSATFVQSSSNPTSASNNANVEFDTATANWGTVTHFGIWSASTGGTFYGAWALTASRTINTDDIGRFLANALVITLD